MKQLNKTVLGIVNDQFKIIDDYNGRTGMFAPKPPKKPIIGKIFNGIKNLIKRK